MFFFKGMLFEYLLIDVIFLLKYFCREELCSKIIFYLLFSIGLLPLLFFVGKYDYKIGNPLIILFVIFSTIYYYLKIHLELVKGIKEIDNKWYKRWIFKEYEFKGKYYTAKRLYNNALSTRLGMSIIGVKSFWHILLLELEQMPIRH